MLGYRALVAALQLGIAVDTAQDPELSTSSLDVRSSAGFVHLYFIYLYFVHLYFVHAYLYCSGILSLMPLLCFAELIPPRAMEPSVLRRYAFAVRRWLAKEFYR